MLLLKGHGDNMLRSPKDKVLREIFKHANQHDLPDWPPFELHLLFLLMSIAGMDAHAPQYGFHGYMPSCFPDPVKAVALLGERGYLCNAMPLDVLWDNMTTSALKDELKAHGLATTGNKAALVSRLASALNGSELSHLLEKYAVWYPSDLGFELLYSFYLLFERREKALIDALLANDRDGIRTAYDAIFECIPFRPGVSIGAADVHDRVNKPLSHVADSATASEAFHALCGFKPAFYIIDMQQPSPDDEALARHQARLEQTVQELAQYKARGRKKVRWITGKPDGKDCEICRARNGKEYLIDEAPPCPAHIGCRCCYAPVIDISH